MTQNKGDNAVYISGRLKSGQNERKRIDHSDVC